MSTARELKPCPFCGKPPALEDHRTIWAVRCECGVCMLGERAPEPEEEMPAEYWARFEQSAVDAWNTRQPGEGALTGWQPIETAPKSRDCGSGRIEGVYILGFCPDPDTCNLDSAVCVVWWEPLLNKGKGMWYGEGGFQTHPTHWMPLPEPPAAAALEEPHHAG